MRLALAPALAVGLLLGACGPVVPPPSSLAQVAVDPVLGSDATGDGRTPVRTLGRAFELVAPGGTVTLAPGAYGADERFPLRPPAGVTLRAPEGGAELRGPGTGTGLEPRGDATIEDLALAGFGVAVAAGEGRLTLRGLAVAEAASALRLTGAARAVAEGLRVAGGEVQIDLDDAAELELVDALLTGSSQDGVLARAPGVRVVVRGGALTGHGIAAIFSLGAELDVTGARLADNGFYGLYAQGGAVRLREAAVHGNGRDGVALLGAVDGVDLGTGPSPGGNDFGPGGAPNGAHAVRMFAGAEGTVAALGNAWLGGVQGADGAGRYAVEELRCGPAAAAPPANYALPDERACLRLGP